MRTLTTLKGQKHDQVFVSGYDFVFLPFLYSELFVLSFIQSYKRTLQYTLTVHTVVAVTDPSCEGSQMCFCVSTGCSAL